MSSPRDVSPAERTDLAWKRTGLGLLSVSGLIGARALHTRASALLVVAGAALAIGLAVLGVLTPLRRRLLRAPGADVAVPRMMAAVTIAVVVVAVAAGVTVLRQR